MQGRRAKSANSKVFLHFHCPWPFVRNLWSAALLLRRGAIAPLHFWTYVRDVKILKKISGIEWNKLKHVRIRMLGGRILPSEWQAFSLLALRGCSKHRSTVTGCTFNPPVDTSTCWSIFVDLFNIFTFTTKHSLYTLLIVYLPMSMLSESWIFEHVSHEAFCSVNCLCDDWKYWAGTNSNCVDYSAADMLLIDAYS